MAAAAGGFVIRFNFAAAGVGAAVTGWLLISETDGFL